MISRIATWVKRFALAGLIFTVVAAVVAFSILCTETGLRWAINRLDASIPGAIEVERFEGTLWSGVYFPSFRYHDATRTLHASAMKLRISWPTLLTGEVLLDDFSAAAVTYEDHRAPDSNKSPFVLAIEPLPVGIGIKRSRIGGIVLTRQDTRINFGALSLDDGRLADNRIHIDSVSIEGEAFEATLSSVDADFRGNVPLSLNIEWSLTGDNGSGAGSLDGTLAEINIIQSISGTYSADVSGRLFLLNKIDPEFDVEVFWPRWEIGSYGLENGAARIRGTFGEIVSDFDVTVGLPLGGSGQLSGTAYGSTDKLFEFDIRFKSPFGELTSTGAMNWQPSFEVEAQVSASEIDPSVLVAELSGRLTADANVRVDGSGAFSLSSVSVSGLLNTAEVTASGNVAMASDRIVCDECKFAVGKNRVHMDGGIRNDDISLRLSVSAPELETLWPGISGSVDGEGEVTGSRKNPQFSGAFLGQRLAFNDWSAVRAAIRSSDSTIDTVDITTSVTALGLGQDELGSFMLEVEGAPDMLNIVVDWNRQDLAASAFGSVVCNAEGVTGIVTRASISEPNTGTWSLQDELSFTVRNQGVTIAPHQWSNGTSVLRIDDASRDAGEVRLLAGLTQFPLQLADVFLPENYRLQGTASADVDVTGRSGIWSGSVNWRQDNTILTVPAAIEGTTELVVPQVTVAAVLQGGGANVSAAVSVESGAAGEIELRLSGFAVDSRIDGELHLNGDDWRWLPALIPVIDRFEGAIAATVTANGPLNAPEFGGSLEWSDGSLVVPSLNVPITGINVVIAGLADGAASVQGSAFAGDGNLSVDGRFDNLMNTTRSLELSFRGAGAELFNWPDYRVWASPDLVVTGSDAGWTVNGKVEIPRAEIELRELPENAVLVSEDVSVSGRDEESHVSNLVSGESQLTLGDGVHVKAFGLDTRLRGDLLIRLQEGRAPRAEGQVTLVDGKFTAYGQSLNIDEGTLTFTGPLEDPLVDVRAVRVIESLDGRVTAGIHLRGRGQSLTSTVFSDPVMAEADAFSYLVIGRPLNQATASEGGELSNAAVALGIRQATRLTEQIGQALGLDQLTLAGNGTDTTALVAGKQVNSRLHARYAYGVFSRLGTLLLRYRLSQRLTLEAGAGEQQSIDLLYQVEKQ